MSEELKVAYGRRGDFKVNLGPNAVEVTIPRLLFRDSEKVLSIIAQSIGTSANTALSAIGSIANASSDAAELGKILSDATEELLKKKGFGVVKDLYDALTYGAVSEELFASLEFGEVVGLVVFLIDENFATLKNLSASFGALTMSQNTSNP